MSMLEETNSKANYAVFKVSSSRVHEETNNATLEVSLTVRQEIGNSWPYCRIFVQARYYIRHVHVTMKQPHTRIIRSLKSTRTEFMKYTAASRDMVCTSRVQTRAERVSCKITQIELKYSITEALLETLILHPLKKQCPIILVFVKFMPHSYR